MTDIFIKVDGTAGESQDATHPNEIDVIKWSLNVSQQSPMLSATGRGASKPTVEGLVFTDEIDQNAMGGSGEAIAALLDVKSKKDELTCL